MVPERQCGSLVLSRPGVDDIGCGPVCPHAGTCDRPQHVARHRRTSNQPTERYRYIDPPWSVQTVARRSEILRQQYSRRFIGNVYSCKKNFPVASATWSVKVGNSWLCVHSTDNTSGKKSIASFWQAAAAVTIPGGLWRRVRWVIGWTGRRQ